jgi:hypothetical protein
MVSSGDLSISFDVTQPADSVTIKVYTVAFRKVIEASAPGAYFRNSTAVFHARVFGDLAGGVYYAVLKAENGGESAVSKPIVMLVLK